MKCPKLLVVVFLVVVLAVVVASPATAQVFLDLYGGVVFPRAADTEVKASTGRTDNTVDVKDTFTLGGRVGSWGTEAGLGWFGMALDVSYWQSETKESLLGTKPDVKVLPHWRRTL